MDDQRLPEKVSSLKLKFNFNIMPKPFILRLKIKITFTKIALIYFHLRRKKQLFCPFPPPLRASSYTSNYLDNPGLETLYSTFFS